MDLVNYGCLDLTKGTFQHKMCLLFNYIIVEMPIPNQDSIDNLQGTGILIKLGLNFDQAKTNSAMIHILVLSAKVRRNEQLK